MSNQKNYVGKGKKVNTKFGEMLNVSFKLEDLKNIANEKGYVNVTISEMKEADKYGNTHTCYENTYKKETQDSKPVSAPIETFDDGSDLPF